MAHGLHVKYEFDLPAMLAGPELAGFYAATLAACRRAGVVPGAFCLGRERAAALAAAGYEQIGFDTDLNALINYASGAVGALR
jgi:hypothetical protein